MDSIKASICHLLRFNFSEETCSPVRVFPIIMSFARYLNMYGLIYSALSSHTVTSLCRYTNPIHLSLQPFITLVKLHYEKGRPMDMDEQLSYSRHTTLTTCLFKKEN